MNFENEVDFRLAKMLLADMYHKGVLTEKKRDKFWEALLEYYNPLFKCVEEIGGDIGEGFRLEEIRDRRAHKRGGRAEMKG